LGFPGDRLQPSGQNEESDVLYAVSAIFKAGAEAQRQELHEAFSAHLAQPFIHVRLGGSLRDQAGARTGVLLLMEADTRERIDHFIALSPYGKAALYERIEIDVYDVEVGHLG
jgi:uncharacterized protein YciI